MKEICKKCSQQRKIINKFYGLCEECNYKRLHGKSKNENLQQKHKSYVEKMQQKAIKKAVLKPFKEQKPIKQQTTKEASVKVKLSRLKKEIEMEAVQEGTYFCKGCGLSYPGLDKSHILSVGLYKHLELVKENIELLCRSCHVIWESGSIALKSKLHCFESNLDIMKKYELAAYNVLYNSWKDYLKFQTIWKCEN